MVVGLADPHIKPDGYQRKRWICRCDCGNTVTVEADNLLNGHTRSCGCLRSRGLRKRQFGSLTAVSHIPGTRDYLCQCVCGNQTTVNQDDLFWKTVTDCGCQKKQKTDITGQRFGKLVALRETEPATDSYGRPVRCWLCRCDCGRETVVRMKNLKNKITRSCGCLKREKCLQLTQSNQ